MKSKLLHKWSSAALAAALVLGTLPYGFAGTVHAAGEAATVRSPSILSGIQKAAYVSPKLDTTTSEPVRVIVQLSGQPSAVGRFAALSGETSLAEQSTEAAALKEQSTFLSRAAAQGVSAKVNYKYTTVLNGMELTVPGNQISKLAKLPGVKSIYENVTYYSLPGENPLGLDGQGKIDLSPLEQMGVPVAWEKGITGKGLKIGVIDTGVDYEHPDLKGAFKGGYDSFQNDPDPYEEPPIEAEGFEGTDHGTHVSGTIAGRAAQTGSDVIQKGVAYEADLYVYKVLGHHAGSSTASGSSAQVIDGIERAVKDGMDVINLSLGSDAEKDPNSPDAIAINNAVLAGVVAVVANGNAADKTGGTYYYSMGSPASSQLAISVGAANTQSVHYEATVSDSVYGPDVHHPLQMMSWQTFHEDFASLLGTEPLEGVYLGIGDNSDYEGKDVAGKVAFVSRGTLTFADKLKFAQAHGVKALIVFNGIADSHGVPDLSEHVANRDGFIHLTLGDFPLSVPMFDMTGTEGRAVARWVVSHPEAKLQFQFGSDYPKSDVAGDQMASFSSRGPELDGNYSIKPDLTGPGVNILSTWPAFGKFDSNVSYKNAYNRISGTSMATPHVAGAALLLKQQHPEWTPFDIRAALANTAVEIHDEDGTPYDVYSQGAGRISVSNAVYTPAVLETVDQISILDKDLNPHTVTNYNDNASFGLLAPGASKTEALQLKNTSDKGVVYQASVVMHPSVTSDPYDPVPTPDVSKVRAVLNGLSGGAVAVKAGSKESFTLQVTPDADAAPGVYEGEVLLKADQLPDLHLPFVVHVGTEAPATGLGLENLVLSASTIDPKGTPSSTNITVTTTESDVGEVDVNIYGLDDELVGTLALVNDFDPDAKAYKPLPPQTFRFTNLTNKYFTFDNSGNVKTGYLNDGVYKLSVEAYRVNTKGKPVVDADGNPVRYSLTKPFSVKTTTSSGGSGGGSGNGNGSGSGTGTGGGGGGGGPAGTSETVSLDHPAARDVIAQGQKGEALPAALVTDNGKVKATVSNTDLQKALQDAGDSPAAVVTGSAGTGAAALTLDLTADQTSQLAKAKQGSTLVVVAGTSSVAVPVSVLAQAPAGAGIRVAITAAGGQKDALTRAYGGTTILGTPVSYELFSVTDGVETAWMPTDRTFIKRSFTIPGKVDAQTAGALYLENGNAQPIPAVFQAHADGTTTVTVSRPGFSVYAAATRTIRFDDISNSWAKTQIQTLADKFLLNGTDEGKFSPDQKVTRAEFAAFLVRALGLQAAKAAPFADVKAGDWFAADVAAAYEAGLIQGVDSTTFAPQASITRQDMTVLLARAAALLKLQPKSEPSRHAYADEADFADYAKSSIQAATGFGLISGSEEQGATVFKPNASTTREEAAMVLYNLLRSAGLIN